MSPYQEPPETVWYERLVVFVAVLALAVVMAAALAPSVDDSNAE
jgi:hypothetical protein